jgi:hypothetical protein
LVLWVRQNGLSLAAAGLALFLQSKIGE